jgi:DNA polymerase III epsilon subunit-like protein
VAAQALSVNKINLIEHDKIAVPAKDAKIALFNFLAENSKAGKDKLTVVGWNIHFDLGFIYEHLLPKSEWEKSVSYRTLDLQPVGAMLKLAGKVPATLGSLGSYAEHFGMDTSKAHDAKEDVKLTLGVFKKFKELI